MDDVMERLRLLDEGIGILGDSIIIASIDLPVRVTKSNNKLHVSYTNSLVIPGLHKIRRQNSLNSCQVKFVGYCGYTPSEDSIRQEDGGGASDDPSTRMTVQEERAKICELLEPFDCYPVFAPEGAYNKMLDFCQSTLSPVFHSIIETYQMTGFDYSAWSLYQVMNKLWSDRVCELIQDDHDIIWVHDIFLLLAPQMISRRNRRVNLSLFIHCPFPSSDMFMCLPVRMDIIRSMLCCDLVGFHFFEYARHFLTVCKRLMGISHKFNLGGFMYLEYNKLQIQIKIGHVNVQYQDIQNMLADDVDMQKLCNDFRTKHYGKFIFVSVDRCDHLSGIKMKLQAYRYYLEHFAYTIKGGAGDDDGGASGVNPLDSATGGGGGGGAPGGGMRGRGDSNVPHEFNSLYSSRSSFQSHDESAHGGGFTNLSSYKENRGSPNSGNAASVVLIQYAYPPRHVGASCLEVEREIQEMADGITRDFGPGLVELHCRPISQKEKWAALKAADCLLDSSIRDGLNLIAFEYIACKGSTPSHIILSEFTGCASTLTCCQRIHPWQIQDVASKMDFSYSTPASANREKWARDVAYLSANSMESWATDFLGDVRRAKKVEGKIYMRCGFASTYRVLSLDENFRPLNVQEVVRAYRSARNKRLLFFDHEGTLAPDRRHIASTMLGCNVESELSASGARPSQGVRDALTQLSADPRNIVYVFSGRPKQALEQWFGDIPNLGICAEHGYHIKYKGQWECMAQSQDFIWKEVALKLMQHYVRRTQGAFIENKGSALVFQYRNSDPDFGGWQAKELATYLEEFLFGMPVVVMTGKGYVEARIAGVSKGIACQWVIERVGEPIQFALAIGDDRSDEEMFQVLANLMPSRDLQSGADILTMTTSPRSSMYEKLPCSSSASRQTDEKVNPVFSVTVGKKPSAAKWFLNDTDEVSDLLDALIGQRTIGSFDVFDSDDAPIDFSCF